MKNIYKDKNEDEVELVINYKIKSSMSTCAINITDSDNAINSNPKYDDYIYEIAKTIKPNRRFFEELPSVLMSNFCLMVRMLAFKAFKMQGEIAIT